VVSQREVYATIAHKRKAAHAAHARHREPALQHLPALSSSSPTRRNFCHNNLARAKLLLNQKPHTSDAPCRAMLYHVVFRFDGTDNAHLTDTDCSQHRRLCKCEREGGWTFGLVQPTRVTHMCMYAQR
jgi:hypothetical protein